MVESLEEAKRRGKKDIPPIAKIKNIYYAAEWDKKFKYPLNEIPVADYYVEYSYNAKDFGSNWLIEASISSLHNQIKQIEASAEFFKRRNIPVDTYLIVIDRLTKRDKQKYKLKDATLKPLKHVFERIDYDNEKPYLMIGKKPLFLIFRDQFERLLK